MTQRHNLILLLCSCLILCFLYLMAPPMYETIDDMAIIGLLSGKFGSISTADGVFLSPLLGHAFHALYQVAGSVPWFSLFLYGVQTISLFLMLKTIGRKSFLIVGVLGLYSYLFYRLNYSSTALFLAFSCGICILQLNVSERAVRKRDAWLGILLALSYLVRPDLSLIALAFLLPVLGSFCWRHASRRALWVLVPLLCIVGLSSAVDSGNQQYRDLQSARSDALDTQKSYYGASTQAALQQAGWSDADYRMLRLWWTHEEDTFSPDQIETFLAANHSENARLFTWKRELDSFGQYRWLLLLVLLGMMFAFVQGGKRSGQPEQVRFPRAIRWYLLASAAYVAAGMVVLAGIRFPGRIAVPTLLYLFSLLLLFASVTTRPSSRLLARGVQWTCGLAIAALLVANHSALQRESEQRLVQKEQTEQNFQKAKQEFGHDAVFVYAKIYTGTEAVNPFLEYQDFESVHAVPYGWMIGTDVYHRFLEQMGIRNGAELIPYAMQHKQQVVFSYWQDSNGQFEDFAPVFAQFVAQHENLHVQSQDLVHVGLDSRTKTPDGGAKGWVFFQVGSN